MPKSLSPFVKPLLIALVLLGLPVAVQYRPSFNSVRYSFTFEQDTTFPTEAGA